MRAGKAQWLLTLCAHSGLLGAQAPMSNIDGLEQAFRQALYAVNPDLSGSYSSWNAALRVQVTFRPAGVSLDHADGTGTHTLALRLAGYGYGEQLAPPQPARLSNAGNRIEYQRGPLTEWYVNESQGLEQGFTLAARPTVGEGPPDDSAGSERRVAA